MNVRSEEFVKEQQLPPSTKVEWSRNGTYMVVFTEEGFQLYGGTEMELLHSFAHRGVTSVVFSPNEELAMSFNNTSININDPENYVLWRVREERRVRVFKAE